MGPGALAVLWTAEWLMNEPWVACGPICIRLLRCSACSLIRVTHETRA